MDIKLWRYNATIDGDTIRSPKSFITKTEGITHITDLAYGLARTFTGGANTTVSEVLSPNSNLHYILLFDGDEEVARFELVKIGSEDSMIHFKMNHPYLHRVLDAAA